MGQCWYQQNDETLGVVLNEDTKSSDFMNEWA